MFRRKGGRRADSEYRPSPVTARDCLRAPGNLEEDTP